MFGRYLRMLERAPLWLCVVLALASTAIWWGSTREDAPWNANETLYFVILWSTGAGQGWRMWQGTVCGRC